MESGSAQVERPGRGAESLGERVEAVGRAAGRNSVWVGASASAMAEPSPPAAPVIIAVGMPDTLPTCALASTSHD